MKATELRIGNWCKIVKSPFPEENGEYQIEAITIHYFESGKDLILEPIPLTEKWLLKSGFKKEKKKPSKHHGNYFSMWISDYKYSFAYAGFREDWGFYHSYTDAADERDNNRFDFISCEIKYVHQLQNLYFALTGEELSYENN
ncbi:MAG TPA: hypothetical protein VMV77_09080 [Bacteroidales bacterium]|nr:hypothetical protein [Bacteroidales bacterium]